MPTVPPRYLSTARNMILRHLATAEATRRCSPSPTKDITSPSESRNEPVSCQLPMYGKTPHQVYQLTDFQYIIYYKTNKKNNLAKPMIFNSVWLKMILYLLTERKSFHLEGIACTRNISIVTNLVTFAIFTHKIDLISWDDSIRAHHC